MEIRFVIRGIAASKDNRLCDRVVSSKAWKSRSSALRNLKRENYDSCFNPYISTVTID